MVTPFPINKIEIIGFGNTTKPKRKEVEKETKLAISRDYDMTNMSGEFISDGYGKKKWKWNRKRIIIGGFRDINGVLISTASLPLPKLSIFGDNAQMPELILITGSYASTQRRTGKSVTASLIIYHYMCNDRVSFPLFIFSTGDETLLKKGIEANTTPEQIKEWERDWTIPPFLSKTYKPQKTYFPARMPNVHILCPPYKGYEVQEESDEIWKFPPCDITSPLLFAFTMLRKVSGGEEAPTYMKPAMDVANEIREKNLTQDEAEEYLEKRWFETHPGYDKGALKKVKGALYDLYEVCIDANAPTMEERILKRAYGKPFCYVVNFSNFTPAIDKPFAEHVAELIMIANERYANRMYPKTSYIPPVLDIEEAASFIPRIERTEGLWVNSFIRYISQMGKYGAPIIIVAQDPTQLHQRIIETDHLGRGTIKGTYTHWIECDSQKAWVTVKIMKRLFIFEDGRKRRFDRLPREEQRYWEEKLGLDLCYSFTRKIDIMPPRCYKPS